MLCDKSHMVRTVQQLHNCTSVRKCFYKILRNDDEVTESKDDYSIGLHLISEHSCVNRTYFDELYNVSILENYIHRFSTF